MKNNNIEGVKMKNDKINDISKKLQNLVKDRKTPIVVYKQGTTKRRSPTASSGGFGSDGYSYYDQD